MSQVNIPRPTLQCWAQARSRCGGSISAWRVDTYDCDDPPHREFHGQPAFLPRSHRSSHHLWVWVPDLDGWERE